MFHKTQVIGYMGKDPEVRYLPSGSAVAEFSVATTESWKDKQSGEKREHTEWYNCRCYGKLAELVGEYRKKGDLVFVEGKNRTDKWQDRNTGEDRYATRLQVDYMRGLRSKDGSDQRGSHGTGARTEAPAQSTAGGDDFDDDIPF